ncbi:MAG TPA: hypothetical protein VFT26_11180, partial [Pyrinomonadaceae bacterium]|nr:hypothetical protein [Pyrinomonadaceae bacterium]
RKRTFISTSECLDPVYEPLCSVPSKFQKYFEPVYVTDDAGMLNYELEEVLEEPGRRGAVLDRITRFTEFARYPENHVNPVILSKTDVN